MLNLILASFRGSEVIFLKLKVRFYQLASSIGIRKTTPEGGFIFPGGY
jgi:hypothetical protein